MESNTKILNLEDFRKQDAKPFSFIDEAEQDTKTQFTGQYIKTDVVNIHTNEEVKINSETTPQTVPEKKSFSLDSLPEELKNQFFEFLAKKNNIELNSKSNNPTYNFGDADVPVPEVEQVSFKEFKAFLQGLDLVYPIKVISATHFKIHKVNIYLPKVSFNVDNYPKAGQGIPELKAFLRKCNLLK